LSGYEGRPRAGIARGKEKIRKGKKERKEKRQEKDPHGDYYVVDV
jgi:hypothetical protein